jgi:hypothetical protein
MLESMPPTISMPTSTQTASNIYAQQKVQGKLAHESNVTNHVRNHGYMTQVLNIVGNGLNPITGTGLLSLICPREDMSLEPS